MLEQKKRISFRISSVSSKVEPEPGNFKPAPVKMSRLRNTGHK